MRARAEKNGYKNGTKYNSLTSQIVFGMLPTPNTMDSLPPKEGEAMERIANGARKGRKSPSNLREYVNPKSWEAYMLPTPIAQESDKITGKENQDSLTKRARLETGKTSQLSPLFVEEMMGFPKNWTASPFQSGEENL
jgi:hypothetical protein